MRLLVCVLICTLGCSNSTSYQSESESSGYIDYSSSEFQGASEEVQEDAIIFNTLKDMGYSDADARDAVINTID